MADTNLHCILYTHTGIVLSVSRLLYTNWLTLLKQPTHTFCFYFIFCDFKFLVSCFCTNSLICRNHGNPMGYAVIDHSQVVFATLGILCAVNPCLFSGYLTGILQGPLYLHFWSSQLRIIRYSRAISFVFWVYAVRWFWFFVSLSVCAPNRQLRFMCALSCRINTKSSIIALYRDVCGLAHVLANRFP